MKNKIKYQSKSKQQRQLNIIISQSNIKPPYSYSHLTLNPKHFVPKNASINFAFLY